MPGWRRAPMSCADYWRWMFFAAGPVEAAITNQAMGWTVPDDRRAMMGYGSFDTMVDTLEQAVSAHAHIAGDRFTAADVYVGSAVAWGRQFGILPERSRLHRLSGACDAASGGGTRSRHRRCADRGSDGGLRPRAAGSVVTIVCPDRAIAAQAGS